MPTSSSRCGNHETRRGTADRASASARTAKVNTSSRGSALRVVLFVEEEREVRALNHHQASPAAKMGGGNEPPGML